MVNLSIQICDRRSPQEASIDLITHWYGSIDMVNGVTSKRTTLIPSFTFIKKY